MGFLLGTEKVVVNAPSRAVLDGVSIGVNSGESIGIVGQNGGGKSTLLRVLSGSFQPDDGRVIRTRGVRASVLGQDDSFDGTERALDAVTGGVDEYVWATDPNQREVVDVLLDSIPKDAKVSELSGGQRRRVDLAKALLQDADVLMLDEPTNHLDMKTISWLAGYLDRWIGPSRALLAVSHDRWFLDEVAKHMWEVHDGRVDSFVGGFSEYLLQRIEREREARVREERRQNRMRREMAWLSRGAKARSTKPKFRVDAAAKLIADVPELRVAPEIKRAAAARLGKDVVDVRGASVSYGDNVVLDGVELAIGPASRIGIVGGNGVGKTTLLRLLSGSINPSSGSVRIGSTVRFAMLSQRLEGLEELSESRVREVASRHSYKEMSDGRTMTPLQILEDLGFSSANLNEKVCDLSGGERRRLALMLTLMEEANVLILDEPGNDMDVDMLAALEDMLDKWPATLILVTHDRNLMERATDSQYAIIDGKLRHLPRGISEYLELVESAHDADQGPEAAKSHAQDATLTIADQSRPGGVEDAHETSSGNVQKLTNAEMRQLKKTMSSLERKLETANSRLDEALSDLSLADPTDYEELVERQEKVDELRRRVEQLEEEWLEAASRANI